MKKWIAGLLSLVLTCTTAVPALASTSIVGKIVDSDGDIAGDNYDSIRPGDDYYYIIGKSGSEYDTYMDDDLIRFSLDVEEGKKYIDDEELVEKKFDSTRYICIAFSAKDTYDDEEYKAVLEANFRARKDLVITNPSDYHDGDAFPAFRRATSSDGSYSDAQIRAAQSKYDTAVSQRDDLNKNIQTLEGEIKALNEDISKLETEIADLQKQIENKIDEEKAKQSQEQAAKDAALKTEQDKLATLQSELENAKNVHSQAVKDLEAAQKADADAAAAKAAQDLQALKAPIEAAIAAAQQQVDNAQTQIDIANQQKTAAENLKVEFTATVAAAIAPASADTTPVPTAPVTLKDFLDAYKTSNKDLVKATDFNTKLGNYQIAAGADVTSIPSITIDAGTNTDNVLDVETAMTTESNRLDQLIFDADTEIKDKTVIRDDAQKQVNDKTAELNALQAPAPAPAPDSSNIAALTQAVTDAKTKLDAAEAAFNAQYAIVKAASTPVQSVVKTAYQTLDASASPTLQEQIQKKNDELTEKRKTLTAKQLELTNKKSDLTQKEAAVTNAKTEWDRMKSGTEVFDSGDTFKYTFKVYIQNENIVDDDATFRAGEKGIVVKPVKNEWNTVTWEDQNRTLASLEFRADSDVSFYCPRLSTHWNYYDYADYFDDTDAYLYNFVDSPTIPAATRPTLTLYNPFVDDDDDLTVSTSRTYIYEVDDGELIDVTDEFDFDRNDDDDYVMTTKTRTLGTYIVSNGRANLAERPVIEVDYDNNDIDSDNSVNTSGSTGGHSVNNNQKPVPWTGR